MVAWYGILKSGTRRRAPASLYEVFFLQRYKDAVADDDVVKHLDADGVTCLNKLLGRPYILLRGLWVARWVIVKQYHRVRAFFNRKPENLARVEYRGIQRAFKDNGLRNHLAPFQFVRNFAPLYLCWSLRLWYRAQAQLQLPFEDSAVWTSSSRQRPQET